jgi:hypothetical protein
MHACRKLTEFHYSSARNRVTDEWAVTLSQPTKTPFNGFEKLSMSELAMRNIRLSNSPALEERGDGFRASVFKLFLALGIEEFAVGVQHGKSRYALADWYMVLVRDVQVMVDVADVDMNHDVVLGEEFGIGCLMVVEVQYLAVPAPISAKIQQYTFLIVASDFLGSLNVRGSVSTFGVQTLVHVKDGLSHG